MIAVIGCGNANRSDDAVGLEVVRMLMARTALQARGDLYLFDAGTDGMAVMFAARGCKTLLVIDSCRTGSAPGAIFEVPGREVENRAAHALNLHDFRWDNAIYAGRQIYRDAFPNDVTAYLIEARSVDYGLGLSPEISDAAAIVADKIADRILDLPPCRSDAGPPP
jgi:hydrogenase maturation protease